VTAISEELGRLLSYQEQHRRLLARLALIVIATATVDLVAAVAMYLLERHAKGTEIKTFGQAAFFTTVQLLTVSSQIKNPLTVPGRVIDIALELWAVTVVAGSAGAIATFFQSSDSQ
jgi:voltage-gated potassium channel